MAKLLPLTFRAFLTLVLGVIGFQAMPAQPFAPLFTHGSAFSASTEELALPVRRESAGEVRLSPVQPTLFPEAVPLLSLIEAAELESLAGPHHQTDPPLRPEPLRRSPAPRAPPELS